MTRGGAPPSHSNRPLEKGSIGTKHDISGKLTLTNHKHIHTIMMIYSIIQKQTVKIVLF